MKNYLIIGGSKGIGLATSQFLLDQGVRVFSTYHETPITLSHNHLTSFQLNVLDDTLDFSQVPDELHGLVYCPGAINLAPFARLSLDSFRQDYELQVVGAIKVIQAVLKKLQNTVQSSIVLFSSVAASSGFNFHTQVSTSKSALEGLAVALAAELAPKVRVNVVAPSITHTPLAERFLNTEDKIQNNERRHPLNRIGDPSDIAKSVGFLLTDSSSWMTGQVIRPDGGISKIKM